MTHIKYDFILLNSNNSDYIYAYSFFMINQCTLQASVCIDRTKLFYKNFQKTVKPTYVKPCTY